MYRVTFYSYCGMPGVPHEYATREEARRHCAEVLRDVRDSLEGFDVVTLRRGEEWEVQEPDGCGMVPDDCGILRLLHITYGCGECGHEHETRQQARECCYDSGE